MPSHLPPCKHDQSKAPSRPGELHPEPLTEPDVNLSIHPARATQRRLPPSIKTRSSSGCPLTPARLGDLLPSLYGHYAASSLLLSSATLVGASVLSASWGFHLHLFPFASPNRFSSSVRKPRLESRLLYTGHHTIGK